MNGQRGSSENSDDLPCLPAQRQLEPTTVLHPLSGDHPQTALPIDLGVRHAADFALPCPVNSNKRVIAL